MRLILKTPTAPARLADKVRRQCPTQCELRILVVGEPSAIPQRMHDGLSSIATRGSAKTNPPSVVVVAPYGKQSQRKTRTERLLAPDTPASFIRKQMTSAEYWFYTIVVTERWPLRLLESDDLELHVNGPGHGLNHQELVDTLDALFCRGSLIARDNCEAEFSPDRASIERGLGCGENLYFGLTARGGREWETVARPDWSRYVDARATMAESGHWELEIVAGTHELVEEAFSIQAFGRPIPGSDASQVISPWQATYWKSLPLGYRLTAHCSSDDAYAHSILEQHRDRIHALYTWHKDPSGWNRSMSMRDTPPFRA